MAKCKRSPALRKSRWPSCHGNSKKTATSTIDVDSPQVSSHASRRKAYVKEVPDSSDHEEEFSEDEEPEVTEEPESAEQELVSQTL